MSSPNVTPIDADAECEACPIAAIDRRKFLLQGAIAAAVAALAACGVNDGATAPTSISTTSIKISDYPPLASTGGVALVNAGGASVAVVRTGTDTFLALSRVCPHQGGTINPTSTGFLCTQHGAQFSRTGTWTGGQRTSNMYQYPTQFDASTGTLTIG